jgi:pSer/pThr/pTyr-binding forkhead associated (FHA) protein
MRRIRRYSILPICCWLLLALSESTAQSPGADYLTQTAAMPAWTVPVLRLVSATHVEPTTGVVISDSGLVIVPGDFASTGDEIIVLDGGTDLIRNGRPAKIERRFGGEHLLVLSVRALRRQGVKLSADSLADGSAVSLFAFPPAELIAQGEPPLNIPAQIALLDESGKTTISGRTPLPNVSGALVDSCGNLVGISAADGVQSMSTSESPQYHWKDVLLRVFAELQIDAEVVTCGDTASTTEAPAPPEEETALPKHEPAVEETQETPEASQENEPQEDPEEASRTEEESEVEEEQVLAEEPATGLESLPPDESAFDENRTMAEDEGEDGGGFPAWLSLLAAVVLFGLAFLVHRLRGKQGDAPSDEADSSPTQELAPAVNDGTTQDGDNESDYISPGLDSRLAVRGVLPSGEHFEKSCAVSQHAVNVVIGRSNADISIDSPAISRLHAGLNGAGDMLTLSDLGSSNGTSINGVPCLEGETMYIGPGDTIVLGDVRISVELRPDPQAGEQAKE